MILGACWLFDQFLSDFAKTQSPDPSLASSRDFFRRGAIAAPIACGLLVALISGVSVNANLGGLERDFVLNINLADAG